MQRLDQLLQVVNHIQPLGSNLQTKIKELFIPLEMKKNDYFAREGEYSSRLGFVNDGVLRAFYRSPEGKEYNKTFFTKNSFPFPLTAAITRDVNFINIQSLTDSIMLETDYYKIVDLFIEFPEMERFSRLIIEKEWIKKEHREIDIVMKTAEERYEIFDREHPRLELLIPQYHIASYLGITPVQLSRIRRKK